MQLKLTEYVEITFSLLYKPKKPFKFRYLEIYSEILTFHLCCTENQLFWVRRWLWRHCDVILGMLVLILVRMERGDPQTILLYQLDVSGDFHFQVHMGGNPPPLVKTCLKKRVCKTRVKATVCFQNMAKTDWVYHVYHNFLPSNTYHFIKTFGARERRKSANYQFNKNLSLYQQKIFQKVWNNFCHKMGNHFFFHKSSKFHALSITRFPRSFASWPCIHLGRNHI